jgi:hypothetical protein
MSDFNTYLTRESFPEGTIFKYLNVVTAEVTEGGYILQTKRGILEGEECNRIFTTLKEWLKTLPLFSPEDDYRINIITPPGENKKVVPPTFPIYMLTIVSPFEIVKAINEKYGIDFKFKRSPSLTMIHSAAKIRRLELESSEAWQLIKITDPDEWQAEYERRTRTIVDAYVNVQNAIKPSMIPYKVHNPKYPRVFVKNNDTMVPIYHITDGTDYIYIDGKVGKTWEDLGLHNYPEFWISWEGRLVRQRINFYIPNNFEAMSFQTDFTQLSLSLMYKDIPNEEGCLPNGKQVINLKTKQYLQPWQII